MAEEHFDILDDKGNITGEMRSRSDVHGKGLLHKSVHVWLLNSKKELLLQKRSLNDHAYPGLWDISASGHISAGQTSLEAARSETKDELGINLPDTAFKHLFTIEERVILHNGTLINNEFQDVYLVNSDVDPSTFNLQKEEVGEIKWIPVEEFKLLTEGDTIVPHEKEHRKLLKFLDQ